MKPINVTVINIQPQTHVRSTKGDRWLFAVSDEYLEEYDRKRVLDDPEAKPGRNMNRKRQLEKYNAYKQELRHIADRMGFKMPQGYFAIWFYIPYPQSWRRKKIAEMLYKPHQATPDCDNLMKSFLDSVMPRKSRTRGEKGCDDRKVHCYAAFKVWVGRDDGCIKILEYDSAEFEKQFQDGHPLLIPDYPVN